MGVKAYAAGNFELSIDGQKTAAYLKSVDGGFVRASTIDEPIGPYNVRVKHTSTVEIEPFSIDFGLSTANEVLLWIQSSWRRDQGYSRRNGMITHADFNFGQTLHHEFYDALIAETTFPALDGASKESAYMKLKIQPEKVETSRGSGSGLLPAPNEKQKMWMCSGFRLSLQGLPELDYVNKIESFTVKQGIKKFYTGNERFPQIEPTKIEFPNLVGTIAEGHSAGLQDWYNRYVVQGQADPKAQKSGSLAFLSPDRKSEIFRINLFEVGIHHLQVTKSDANADQIKRVKFEVYVGRMELDGAGPLGMA